MNTEIRRKDRAITDKKEIQEILQKAKFLHLGLMDGDYPYIVPLHYGFTYSEEKDEFTFYMHGAKVGHKINLIEKCSNAFVELETDIELESGGDNPYEYSSFYSSFMGKGTVSLVEDEREKEKGLQLLMRNQTDREFQFTEKMLSAVAVIKVCVRSYTAKAKKH